MTEISGTFAYAAWPIYVLGSKQPTSKGCELFIGRKKSFRSILSLMYPTCIYPFTFAPSRILKMVLDDVTVGLTCQGWDTVTRMHYT